MDTAQYAGRTIEEVATDSIVPYELNNKIHGPEAIDRVANSIREFGWTQPILVDETNVILAGHKRHAAARKLGLATVPIIRVAGLTAAQRKAYRIVDNKSSEESEWDLPNLGLELDSLEELGFDIEQFVISDWGEEHAEASPQVADDGYIADPEKIETRIKRGDVIELGEHRLMCGDATSADDIDALFAAERPAVLCWDPPFNVGFDYDGAYSGQDRKSDAEYMTFLNCVLSDFMRRGTPDHRGFVWQGLLNVRSFADWFSACGDWRLMAIAKNFVQARPTWLQWAWDPVIAFIGPEYTEKKNVSCRDWFLANTAATTPTDDRRISGVHPCPRPLDAVCYVLAAWSEPGDLVVDYTLGSGTTIIAADTLGRRCYGLEIEPRYCQVIVDRYRAHCAASGKECVIRINGEVQ